MSYVLHFWRSPVPRDFADAEKIISELSKDWERDWKPNPKFTELLRQLAARFPNESGVFEESELRTRETYPLMYVVGIQCIQTEAQPTTVSMANALGLTVYDMQLGKVYLPGGIVFASAGPHTADPGDAAGWKAVKGYQEHVVSCTSAPRLQQGARRMRLRALGFSQISVSGRGHAM